VKILVITVIVLVCNACAPEFVRYKQPCGDSGSKHYISSMRNGTEADIAMIYAELDVPERGYRRS